MPWLKFSEIACRTYESNLWNNRYRDDTRQLTRMARVEEKLFVLLEKLKVVKSKSIKFLISFKFFFQETDYNLSVCIVLLQQYLRNEKAAEKVSWNCNYFSSAILSLWILQRKIFITSNYSYSLMLLVFTNISLRKVYLSNNSTTHV